MRMTSNQQPQPQSLRAAQRAREQELIRRDQQDRALEQARRELESGREKRRGETDLDWKTRVALLDQAESGRGASPLTPEAEQHGSFESVFMPAANGQQAKVRRRKSTSGLYRMWEKGSITAEQLDASTDIALVAERIERAVSIRCASLEARVDNSGSARDILAERLNHVRAEATYTRWRNRLPTPKRMILDMVLTDRDLFITARVYSMGWPKARRLLIRALDNWIDIKAKVWKDIDERDVTPIHLKLGGGYLID